MNNTAVIRLATVDDAAELAELGERSFRETFAADNRPEDIEAYIAVTYSLAKQRSDLLDPDRMTLLVHADDRLIAYAQLRAGAVPDAVTGPSPIEVLRFYVDRPWHGQGIARRLMDAVMDVARDRGAETLWLAVWEFNPRAVAFYTKCGFRDVGSKPFVLGTDHQTDRVMTRGL